MKTGILIIAAAMPFIADAAGAEKGVVADDAALRDAVTLTTILEANVESADGREIADLANVLIATDGRIKAYLLDASDTDAANTGDAVTFADDVADFDEAPVGETASREDELQLDHLVVDARNAHYDDVEQVLEVDLGGRSLGDLPQQDRGVSGQNEGVYGDDLIGMEVNLADAESFGEIEDVLVDADGARVVAYVVDSIDGLDRKRHALRADAAQFNTTASTIRQEYGETEIDVVNFPYTREQLDAAPQFDLDAHATERNAQSEDAAARE